MKIMFLKAKNDDQAITEYIKSVIRYPLFADNDQNNEYEIKKVNEGFLFVPIYPITFLID